MGKAYEKADTALSQFVGDNEEFIRGELGPGAQEMSRGELYTVASYFFRLEALAEVRNGESSLGNGFMGRMQALRPAGGYDQQSFLKAIAWFDQGQILKGRLTDVMRFTPQHSPAVNDYLINRRKEKYRAAFVKVTKMGSAAKREFSALSSLVSSRQIFDRDAHRKMLSHRKNIRALVRQMAYHAKVGAAWALAAGFKAKNAEKSVGRIFLNRFDSLMQVLSRTDFHLQERGVNFKLTSQLWKIHDRVRNELSDAVLLELRNERSSSKGASFGR